MKQPPNFKRFISIIVLIIWIGNCPKSNAVKTKLTNLKCETFDPSYAFFRECRLKVIGRGIVAANINIKLCQLVEDNIVIYLGLYKKASGYKPFLYNTSIDYCQAAKKSIQNILWKIVFNFFKEYSNVNHTCPFENEIIVSNFVADEEKFRLIPLPTGDYMLLLKASVNNDYKVMLNVFFTRAD